MKPSEAIEVLDLLSENRCQPMHVKDPFHETVYSTEFFKDGISLAQEALRRMQAKGTPQT